MVGGAEALAGETIVGRCDGTVDGEAVAVVGGGAPAGSDFESDAIAAPVVGKAAIRNVCASELCCTPSEARRAHTQARGAVVVVGALVGNVVARIGSSAPGGSGVEAKAVAAVVVVQAAAGNDNALAELGAPGLPGGTDALPG